MQTLARTVMACWLMIAFIGCARAEDQFFNSGSVKIRYVVEGKGEPVVLIHGFTSNAEATWGKVIKPLAESYQVIAMDCRGHGKSDKPTDPKAYGRELGEDVVRLMDHLHIGKAHVAGYSMGAYIAYGVLLMHPDRVLTLTLGAGGGIPEPGTPDTVKAVAESLEKNKSFEPLIHALWPPNMPAPTPEQITLFNKMLVGNRTDDDLKALAAVMRGGMGPGAEMSNDDLNSHLKANTAPILGIAGGQDPARKNVQNLQARLKELKGDHADMKVVVIDMANHVDTTGKPEFLAAIQEFLKAHPAPVKTL